MSFRTNVPLRKRCNDFGDLSCRVNPKPHGDNDKNRIQTCFLGPRRLFCALLRHYWRMCSPRRTATAGDGSRCERLQMARTEKNWKMSPMSPMSPTFHVEMLLECNVVPLYLHRRNYQIFDLRLCGQQSRSPPPRNHLHPMFPMFRMSPIRPPDSGPPASPPLGGLVCGEPLCPVGPLPGLSGGPGGPGSLQFPMSPTCWS